MTKKSNRVHVLSTSAEETMMLGRKMAISLRKGDIVLLFGGLGSGKTCFVQGLAQGLHIEQTINSPTYVYIHPYETKNLSFFHIDLYRLQDKQKMQLIGMEDILQDCKNIIAVEWPEILLEHYPSLSGRRVIRVEFEFYASEIRKVDIQIKENK